MTSSNFITTVKPFFLNLQQLICQAIESEENGACFQEDIWQHPQGGGGITRVINGHVIEKGGVNFSHITGTELPQAALTRHPEFAGAAFEALGVSVVLHPQNPYVPTAHMNIRFILVEKENNECYWWFGGGFDLTPYYGFKEDCEHWHSVAKKICLPFGDDVYPRFKKWCDDYFYLKHRKEPRGIGGLFFDELNTWGFDQCFAFTHSVGDNFMTAYQPILARRKNTKYTQRERDFQLYRRGRYVEFNLLYDRGTLFGLQSGGRTESILMSLPPLVVWQYDYNPQPNSPESLLYSEFLQPKEWISSKIK